MGSGQLEKTTAVCVFGSHPLPPHGSIPSAALHTGQGLLRRRTHTHSRGDVSCYLASEAFKAPFHPHAFSHTVSREKWLRAEDEIKPECVTYFKRQMWVLGTKPTEKGCQLPSNQQRKLKKKDKIELTEVSDEWTNERFLKAKKAIYSSMPGYWVPHTHKHTQLEQ